MARFAAVMLAMAVLAAACGDDPDAATPASTTSAPVASVPATTDAPAVAPTSAPVTAPPAPAATDSPATAGGCADVIDVELAPTGDGVFTVKTTIRSADTGIEKYADLWRVEAPDGEVLGTRVLAHPHVDEQPFTRSLPGVDIPADVESVTVAARDSVVGFCGAVLIVPVPVP